jgi:hypothetical protein
MCLLTSTSSGCRREKSAFSHFEAKQLEEASRQRPSTAAWRAGFPFLRRSSSTRRQEPAKGSERE